MKKIALVTLLMAQAVFAKEQVSPGFGGTLPDGLKKKPLPPSEYQLMGAVLSQPALAEHIWVFIGLNGVAPMAMVDVQITPLKNNTKNHVRFDLVIHKKDGRGRNEDQNICSTVDFVNGPGPSPSGDGEAVNINQDWWILISYHHGACKGGGQ